MEVTMDWIWGLAYFLLGVFGAGIVILIDNFLTRRKTREAGDNVGGCGEEDEKPTQEKIPEGPIGLDEVIELDKALAVRFYRELKKALRENKVRVTLVSELCPNGRIAYDFATSRWIFVEEDGTS